MRRIFKFTSVIAMLFFHIQLSALPLPTVLEPSDSIEIDSGEIVGKVLNSKVKAWFGVPYAKSPVRELRWREPQPITWEGSYNADRFGPQCIQPLRGSNINHYFGHEATSEDCLYLNIWAPEDAEENNDYPVVVWIYGGGYKIGSASMRNYSGEELAKKGVIFVSVSYRVGALGFMAHPELSEESSYNASGNYGLLDQVAALEWINRNINKFGGDPESITIMGQSAGSGAVSSIQASPQAKGLFHRIVGMSGSAVASTWTSREDSERSGLNFEVALGVSSVEELRHIPADRIMSMQKDCQLGCAGSIDVGPSIDGYFLPASPAELFKQNKQSDVPVMIGFTRDEGFSPIGQAQSMEELDEMLDQAYGSKASLVREIYSVNTHSNVSRVARDIARDSTLSTSMYQWAKLQLENGQASVFSYQFARVHPYTEGINFDDHSPENVGAYHSGDIPYWLQTLDSLNIYRETRTYKEFDQELSDLMSSSIIEFAYSGNPSTATLIWPTVKNPQFEMVQFGLDEASLYEVMQWPNIKGVNFFIENPAAPVTLPRAQEGQRARD